MSAATLYRTDEPVVLNGFQAILKPGANGYCIAFDLRDQDLMDKILKDRESLIENQKRKLKDPKRFKINDGRWEETSEGVYNLKMSWSDKDRPPIVDAEGTPVTDENLRLFSGAKVRVAFNQYGYNLVDGRTIGTKLGCKAIQIIEIPESGVKLDDEKAAEFFGNFEGGFVASDIPEAGLADDDELDDELDEAAGDF